MNSLTRFDPFTRGFDDIFRGTFLRPVRFDVDALPELQIKLPKKAASASRRIAVS